MDKNKRTRARDCSAPGRWHRRLQKPWTSHCSNETAHETNCLLSFQTLDTASWEVHPEVQGHLWSLGKQSRATELQEPMLHIHQGRPDHNMPLPALAHPMAVTALGPKMIPFPWLQASLSRHPTQVLNDERQIQTADKVGASKATCPNVNWVIYSARVHVCARTCRQTDMHTRTHSEMNLLKMTMYWCTPTFITHIQNTLLKYCNYLH